MINIMQIGGQKAIVAYDPEIEMFRGEFVGLNGGADFYATDVAGLHREGEQSLNVFLEECRRRGVEPYKQYSGKFVMRLSPGAHHAAATAAAARGVSLNQWAAEVLEQAAVAD
ncbi:type II toxin-antitoxin system HicB family antitoxin [Paraburkholderia adhaesiva]|uniref:type II toxin-antitoxin system HicB family antitoxin n=1 Tax=Paraburkholderia adhaesiva TaxID=2883244 RepID=UPI001F2092F3|nr:type II toxin-antitoxin system HicB family antitoxin [Paraburkholderia adhaesiva]